MLRGTMTSVRWLFLVFAVVLTFAAVVSFAGGNILFGLGMLLGVIGNGAQAWHYRHGGWTERRRFPPPRPIE